MRLSTAVEQQVKTLPARSAGGPGAGESDVRWQLAQRVIGSRHFARSPLLSRFLLHIVSETLQDRSGQITEHQIGVGVFERPTTYRTVEDNLSSRFPPSIRSRTTTCGAARYMRERMDPVEKCSAGTTAFGVVQAFDS